MDLIKSESKDLSKFICIICNEHKEYYSIGKCNHRVTCMYCTLKCRSFYNDKRCPLCNVILEEIFISPITEEYLFDDLNKNDKSIFFIDDDFNNNGVYYVDISSKEESLNLKGFKCPINYCSSDPFDNINLLKKHLSENHLKYYCDVCLKDGKKFLSEQKIFAKDELKFHNKFGDFTQYIPPHPKCPFCKDLYYNDELLFKHMSQLHFLCEICKNKEKKIIFYSNLPNLIQHNKINHYCCPYKECIDNLYVSFGSEKEFYNHLISKHHINNIGRKLNLMVLENQPQENLDSEIFDISLYKDEFNFKNYIQRLNEKCIRYKEEMENKKFYDINEFNNEKSLKLNLGAVAYVPKTNIKVKQNKKKNSKANFILQNYLKIIKDYIIERIKVRGVKEEKIELPKDIIYQLIMIIDKIDSYDKLLEFHLLHNFGISMESVNSIKAFLSSNNDDNKDQLFNEFDNLTMRNMLILYKYVSISSKKISGSFFKLEFAQINEDLYQDFIKEEDKKEKLIELNSNSFAINYIMNNYHNYAAYNNHHQEKKEKNWNQKIIPGLNGNNYQKISNIYYQPGNLTSIRENTFGNYGNQNFEKEEINNLNNKEDIKNDNKNDNKDKNKTNKSKLSMLLDNRFVESKSSNNIFNEKKKYGKKGKKKQKFIDLDLNK
jgi:hypothetical protein